MASTDLKIVLPEGVEAGVQNSLVTLIGVKGSLARRIPTQLEVKLNDKVLTVKRKSQAKSGLSEQGTMRAHLVNMIKGVSLGWSKTLELVGAGYKAEVKGENLILSIGYSHPVVVPAPPGVKFIVEKSLVKIEGFDKEVVGAISAKIKNFRTPDPYKGKGIRYKDETIRRKAGKQAVKAEGV